MRSLRITAAMLIVAVIIPSVGVLPVNAASQAAPQTYEECIARYGNTKNADKLRDKVSSAIQKRQTALNNLSGKISKYNQVSSDHKTALVKSIESDKAKLEAMVKSSKTDNAKVLVQNYCNAVYQISNFRAQQVKYTVALDTMAAINSRMNSILSNPANQNVNNPLKGAIDERLNAARDLVEINQSFFDNGITADAVIGAPDIQTLFDIIDPSKLDIMRANANEINRLHTEAWAIRKAGTKVEAGKTATLENVKILLEAADQNGATKGSEKSGVNVEQQKYDVDTVTVSGIVYTSAANFGPSVQKDIDKGKLCFYTKSDFRTGTEIQTKGSGKTTGEGVVWCGAKGTWYLPGSTVRDDSYLKSGDKKRYGIDTCYRSTDKKEGTFAICGSHDAFYGGGRDFSIWIISADKYNRYTGQVQGNESTNGRSAKKATVTINVDGQTQTINLVRNQGSKGWQFEQ